MTSATRTRTSRFLPSALAFALAIGVVAAVAAPASAEGPAGALPAGDKKACIPASEEGQQLKNAGKLTRAIEKFEVCAREICPAAVRDDCVKFLEDVRENAPTVVFSAKDAAGKDAEEVVVSMDGAVLTRRLDGRAVMVDPGLHSFKFEIAGQPPLEQTTQIAQGSKNRAVSVAFGNARAPASPQPSADHAPPRKSLVPAYVGAGVFVVGVGTGMAFYASGLGAKSDLTNAPCHASRTCPQDQVDGIKSKLVIGDVATGIGILGGAFAVYWALAGSRPSEEAPPTSAAAGVLDRIVRASRGVAIAPAAGGGVASFASSF